MTLGPSFVCLHVPRTASNTMSRRFLKQFGGERIGKHHERIVPIEHIRKFTFAVVRNPYDRWLSCWHHLRRNDRDHGIADMCFPEFMHLMVNGWGEGGYSQVEFLAEARMDRILKYEDLAESVLELPFNAASIPWPSEKMNSEVRLPWRVEMAEHPNTWMKIVEAVSGGDFLRYGYEQW